MMEGFLRETAAFGITLSTEQLNQFTRYQDLLLAWNQRFNLTAIRNPREIQRRHFLDSLTCATVMDNVASQTAGDLSLIDVGTGAGFPGLPLKILFPNLQLTLVDSTAKKTRFLEAVVAELGLSGVRVVAERAEVLGQDGAHRERYDWAVARAVAELRVLVEYLLPLCRVGGRALAQKGENAPVEVEAAARAVTVLGGAAPVLHPISLPQRAELHYLVLIDKTTETPASYPRRKGIPAKRPL